MSFLSFTKPFYGDTVACRSLTDRTKEVMIIGQLCIGLFGTCGGSTWRDPFMKRYGENKIPFYNPQVDDWDPAMAEEEARHLAEDEIILFPVTDETDGLGSLSEVGFSILNAISLDDRREFVVMIDREVDATKVTDPEIRERSIRARALVLEHLRKLRLSNVYIVESLEEMLEVSLQLYEAASVRVPLRRYNPHESS